MASYSVPGQLVLRTATCGWLSWSTARYIGN